MLLKTKILALSCAFAIISQTTATLEVCRSHADTDIPTLFRSSPTSDLVDTFQKYLERAQNGDIDAQLNVAWRYEDGTLGVDSDMAQAAYWLGQAATGGNRIAQESIGNWLLWGYRGVEKNIPLALVWLNKAADQGSVTAISWMAQTYAKGDGLPVDQQKATTYFAQGASFGHTISQLAYAQRLKKGLGIPQDLGQAAAWFQKAAEAGNAVAQRELGKMHARGHGVAQDYAQAAHYFAQAAAQNDPQAQHQLSLLMMKGTGITQDLVHAENLCTLAATSLNTKACQTLAEGYGTGPHKDLTKKFEWMLRAAQQGDMHAQCAVARMYQFGLGVERDAEQQEKWYKKAADQGHDISIYNLGLMYLGYQGIPQNLEMARFYFEKAVAQNDLDAKEQLEKMNTKLVQQ